MYIDSKGADVGRFQTFLAYGHAMPEGQITYVMRTDGFDVELWSPVTGMCYFFEKNKVISKILGCIPDGDSAYMNVRSNDPICPMT